MQDKGQEETGKRFKDWKIKSNVVELLSLDETSLQARAAVSE